MDEDSFMCEFIKNMSENELNIFSDTIKEYCEEELNEEMEERKQNHE